MLLDFILRYHIRRKNLGEIEALQDGVVEIGCPKENEQQLISLQKKCMNIFCS